jgi:hypothetical protein
MDVPRPLDYEPRQAREPARFSLVTGAAIAFVVVGWISADIPISGIWKFMDAANAVGGGLAILALFRPRRTRAERIVVYIVLAMAVVALATFI